MGFSLATSGRPSETSFHRVPYKGYEFRIMRCLGLSDVKFTLSRNGRRRKEGVALRTDLLVRLRMIETSHVTVNRHVPTLLLSASLPSLSD